MEVRKILKASHRGVVAIGENTIPCAVLEDGTRVLSETGITNAILKTRSGAALRAKVTLDDGALLPVFLASKSLVPFIPQGFMDGAHIIEYLDGEILKKGYNAEILPIVCEIWLSARAAGVLKASQKDKAQHAEIIMRGLAVIGIIALIDEATGYQHDREHDAMQKYLKMYIAEQLMPWQKKFPDVYYRELYRLNGWSYTVESIKKRPGVIGTWTNKLVYSQLPFGVLDELKRKTPKTSSGNRAHNFHQLLTDDIGNPHLKSQLVQVVTLFNLSDNMKHMWEQFEKLVLRQHGFEQLELPYAFDEKGHTVEPLEKSTLTEFDKNLLKAIENK